MEVGERQRIDDRLRATCVLADDHPYLLHGLALILEEAGIDVVARVGDGVEALQAIREHRPDVAVLDVQMPLKTGIQVAADVARDAPATAVVLYTGADDVELLRDGVAAGARGYVLKSRPLEDLAHAVHRVARGRTWVDPGLVGAMMAVAVQPGLPTLPELTSRERDVIHLLAEGFRSDHIAERLGISVGTVRLHVRRVMEKLDADTRTAAVATAIRLAVID